MYNERHMRISLALCPGLEASTLRKLVRALGSASAVWQASSMEWQQAVRLKDTTIRKLDAWRQRLKSPERVTNHLKQKNVQILVHGDDQYPELLNDLDDAPLVLFAKGDLRLLQRPGVSVVGTRRASGYGSEAAKFVSETFAGAGLVLVSGMALGIDGVVHESALRANGSTIAVLGCGVDICYPPGHQRLYERILSNGLIVSEYAPGTMVQKYHFPERNRIIAALGQITVVIQAGERSGALRTVDSTLELGRDVYVVPGPITSLHFRGSHKLLQQGAIPLLDPVDVLSNLGVQHSLTEKTKSTVPERWQPLYEEIFESAHAGALALALSLPPSTVYAGLLELELGGWIVRSPDGSYTRQSSI